METDESDSMLVILILVVRLFFLEEEEVVAEEEAGGPRPPLNALVVGIGAPGLVEGAKETLGLAPEFPPLTSSSPSSSSSK